MASSNRLEDAGKSDIYSSDRTIRRMTIWKGFECFRDLILNRESVRFENIKFESTVLLNCCKILLQGLRTTTTHLPTGNRIRLHFSIPNAFSMSLASA